MSNAIRAVAVATFLAISTSLAVAQELLFQKGFSEEIPIPGSVATVTVGDTEIADVQPLTQNIYLVNAKQVGTTNLIAFDENAKVLYRARLNVRPVDMWPGFELHVTHGINLARSFVCDRAMGCPARATASYVLPTVDNSYSFDTQTNLNTGNADDPAQAGPAQADPQ